MAAHAQVKEYSKKYGEKIRLKIYHPENWVTLESLDAEIKVKEMLKEYEIPTYDEQIQKQRGSKINIVYNNTIYSGFQKNDYPSPT